MAGLSSPLRLAPPLTPRRAPSPTMSPGGRRGRAYGSSEESRLRDLSPDTTLRAFTQRPMPFDTTCDEYKIFACIDTLTAAERDLGARVAKAAQRLKSWCSEIEQWGWSGSFEQPSQEFREQRRKSLELRIREHVGDADLSEVLPPLEYWGPLLSVEVESHEARLDDIQEEMLTLDVEELKEYMLGMHPASRSRPSSAGYEASRQNYKPIDDFSFLITQTLISALPHHAQLKGRLDTWTARISILREVPRYLDDLSTAQKGLRLGWDAIDPPTDTSDEAFLQWKDATDTIAGVLAAKVGDLGKRLDRMLDTLEGRDDCIPDAWIDTFEAIEQDHGRWSHQSRKNIIDFDVRRRWEQQGPRLQHTTVGKQEEVQTNGHSAVEATSGASAPKTIQGGDTREGLLTKAEVAAQTLTSNVEISDVKSSNAAAVATVADLLSVTASPVTPSLPISKNKNNLRILSPGQVVHDPSAQTFSTNDDLQGSTQSRLETPAKGTPYTPRVAELNSGSGSNRSTPSKKLWFMTESAAVPADDGHIEEQNPEQKPEQIMSTPKRDVARQTTPIVVAPIVSLVSHEQNSEDHSPIVDEESEFEEGDTVVHNDIEDSPEAAVPVQDLPRITNGEGDEVVRVRSRPDATGEIPVIIAVEEDETAIPEPPQTPRSRRDSESSHSSNLSLDSSPPSYIEDSPSVRNMNSRPIRASRPELNAAMAKRRIGKPAVDNSIVSAPWPPTQFTQKESAEDLERKISDILNTIPAHIRLTSGPGADAPEVKSARGLTAKGSRNYLRAARSVSGLKSPELTLSPAKNEFDGVASGRKSAATSRADNDIKLYHLTQPGKEQPVKLFIRRVGENGERVMVRVGGGWADLGEYLRQYAEHHGRRTASDGKFEILGLEVNKSDPLNSPNRPESAMSKQDRRVSSGRPSLSPLTTPTKATAWGMSRDDAVPPMPSFASSTPGISEEAAIPSTNSSSRSWTGNEAGLAGPKAKKLDLSGEKLEWIEGMMKQARTVSGSVMPPTQISQERDERAESRSESRSGSRAGGKKPEFGDLGKVGGTKRIFLRGGKPVME
ncbi:hypothetical protein DE146DRAFT_655306 [Phaeosphaeria sp. MPI-PUGE-AT-0046c]|nr:hypothetical protein DE146DRAFT_655306 [Phaeosphaeria sp. MPI-PUGE-AT-0046c]